MKSLDTKSLDSSAVKPSGYNLWKLPTHWTVDCARWETAIYFFSSNAVYLAQEPKDSTLSAFFKVSTNDHCAKTTVYFQVPL